MDIVRYLIKECHVNAEASTNEGYTPLLCASEGGHLAIVQYLVTECHANVDVATHHNSTAISQASQYANCSIFG